jgi:hypothetical protein
MTCSDFLRAAKVWADQLASVGRPIDDEDLISYIISGLNATFNSFITSYIFITRDNPLTFEEFRDELLNHEMLLNQQNAAAPDPATFALFTQRTGTKPHQLNLKGKMSQHFNPRMPQQFNSRFPSRGQNPRFPANNLSGTQYSATNFTGNGPSGYRQRTDNPNFHIGESSTQGATSNFNNLAESNFNKPQQTSSTSMPNLWQNQSSSIRLLSPDGLHLPRKTSPFAAGCNGCTNQCH